MGPCNRLEGRICIKKRESITPVQRRERGDKRIHSEADKKEIYKTIKITTDSTSILCGKEGWKEEDGAGLPVFE